MKILTVCPIKNNDKIEKMSQSFYETAEENNTLKIEQSGTVTEAINKLFNKYPDYDFYHITNDDVKYHTMGWDSKLANKNKISYGNDLFQGENLCTFPMIDGDIVRALGWLQMPTLERYCGDSVWNVIGKACDNLRYYPQVIIEHLWEGYSHPFTADMGRFAEWLSVSNRDIEKIRGKV